MNCDQFKEYIVDFLYNEISEAERNELSAHLKLCPPCHAVLNELKLVRNEMAEWKDPAAQSFPISIPYPSPWALLKRWLMPAQWSARSVGAFAMAVSLMALALFSVLGTEIEISKDRFALRADLWRHASPTQSSATQTPEPSVPVVRSTAPTSSRTPDRAAMLQEVSRMIQQSEARQQQLMKEEEIRVVNQLTSGYRTQLASLANTLDNQHKLDLVKVYNDLEQQRLLDLQKIRVTFTSLDERTSQQARQTQQLVDFIQKASYPPR